MDTKKLWEITGTHYREAQERYGRERYPHHIFRDRRVFEMIDAAHRAIQDRPQKRDQISLLDIGCGSGSILRYAQSKGMRAVGIDYSASMVELCRKELADNQVSDVDVEVADATDLSCFRNESFDIVCAIQVFGYLPRSEESKYMGECKRILSRGGNLITAEPNLIFDIATFNKFTVRFYAEQLLPLSFHNSDERVYVTYRIKRLLTNPDKPVTPLPPREDVSFVDAILNDSNTRYSSHRDQASSKAENPLAYEKLVGKYGFILQDIAFYHFHAVPPLLFNDDPLLEKRAEELEDKFCRSWQGYFMASSFVSRSKKQ